VSDAFAEQGLEVSDPIPLDLAELMPDLLGRATGTDRLTELLTTVRQAGVLVVASPTFKATYTGLLKLFLDLLPRKGLTGVVAVPLMTAAIAPHEHAVETHLRPLLVELGACVPVRGLCVREVDFADVGGAIAAWASTALPVLTAVVGAPRLPSEKLWPGTIAALRQRGCAEIGESGATASALASAE
jgi:FMN reductase